MNKTIKISLISVGLIGAGVGVYFLLKNRSSKSGGNRTYDNNIFKTILNKLYQSDSFPLKKDSGGDRVKALQLFLNNSSSYGLVVDGKFGPATEGAVKNNQAPFPNFKSMFPNAIEGQVNEDYYNLYVSSSENLIGSLTDIGLSEVGSNSTSNGEITPTLTNTVPTGGGYSGLQYAVDPSELSFNGSDWN
jgi:hypothetical protein